MTKDPTARGIEPGTLQGVPHPTLLRVTGLRSHGYLAFH